MKTNPNLRRMGLPILFMALLFAAPLAPGQESVWDGTGETAPGDIEVIQYEGSVCRLVTFEGGGVAPIPTTPLPGTDPIDITFGTGLWYTLTSPPAAFSNAPSPSTAATFFAGPGEIHFGSPVQQVTFYVAAAWSNFTVEAYDSSGALLAGTTRAPNNSGLPLTNWDLVSISSAGNQTVRLVIQAGNGQFLIDDLDACIEDDPPTPPELIEDLTNFVVDLNLVAGIENSLDAKLEAALAAWDDANLNNDQAACNSPQAFINAVEAQRGKKITEADADILIADAEAIIDLICPP